MHGSCFAFALQGFKYTKYYISSLDSFCLFSCHVCLMILYLDKWLETTVYLDLSISNYSLVFVYISIYSVFQCLFNSNLIRDYLNTFSANRYCPLLTFYNLLMRKIKNELNTQIKYLQLFNFSPNSLRTNNI